ncbi:hypothetical protein Gohar_004605 [Gossypium harknessii]|uniref:Cytochrome b5 heme-binding domain-containing protein n=1 Tax=Gossypium harknessii TaxID=34285 RepID=A0A7J9H5G8_9ROSI|nr:hypothetical protein [Gossypium harknessii]
MKSEKARSSTRKSAPRTKVPFEKGYSQMDWLKLTQTHPDLAGLKGQSNRRLVSMSEVKQNQKEGSMWTVLKGRVYNISPYMKFHPGGTQFDKSVDHYATEFSNLFIKVGLNETIDQLRARYLVRFNLSIGDELGMVCVYNLEDARCYDLQAEKRVLLYGARRPLSSRVDGVSKGSYCGKETASSSKDKQKRSCPVTTSEAFFFACPRRGLNLFEHDEGGKELSYPIYDDRKEDDDNVNIYLVLVESLMGLTANLEAERQSEVVQEVLSVKEVKSRRGDACVDMLMKAVGKDSTSLFSSKLGESISYLFSLTCVQDKYHAWVNAEFLLEKCLVGTLDDGEGTQTL